MIIPAKGRKGPLEPKQDRAAFCTYLPTGGPEPKILFRLPSKTGNGPISPHLCRLKSWEKTSN